jgi:hypothetical protein
MPSSFLRAPTGEFLLDLADVLGLDETSVRKIRTEIEAALATPGQK